MVQMRLSLARYGYEGRVKEFNEAAVKISETRSCTQVDVFVLGTIGGIRGIRKSDATLEEIIASNS